MHTAAAGRRWPRNRNKAGIVRAHALVGALGMVAALATSVPSPATAAYDRPGRTERVSVATGGAQARRPLVTLGSCQTDAAGAWRKLDITPDGRFVVFASDADNLVADDLNLGCDVFIRDRMTRRTMLVSVSHNGAPLTGFSETDPTNLAPVSLDPSVSANGRYVAFMSNATNLVPNDSNNIVDVFVYDRQRHTTERVSVSSRGAQGKDAAGAYAAPYRASISRNGRYVVFASKAANLVPKDTNATDDVFVRDRKTNKTTRVSITTSGAQANGSSPSISADGRFVVFDSADPAFDSDDTNATVDVFVRDRARKRTTRISVGSDGRQAPSWLGDSWSSSSGGRLLSDDGRYVVFGSFHAGLVPTDTNWAPRSDARASAADVFVHDLKTHRTERASLQSTGEEAESGAEDFFTRGPGTRAGAHSAAAISPNGRFVVFASVSDDLSVSERRLEDSDVYVYDRRTGQTDWASTARGNVESASTCNAAQFIGGPASVPSGWTGRQSWGGAVDNSGAVAFFSCADDLVVGDSNGTVDVFVHERGSDLGVGVDDGQPGDTLPIPPVATFVDARGDTPTAIGDLLRTRIGYRPELEDVSIRIDAAELMPVETPLGAGSPGLTYGVRFDAAGRSYEARATRTAFGDAFGLFSCDTQCRWVAPIEGGYGTAGEAVVLTIPAGLIGLQPGRQLGSLAAFSALDGAPLGALASVDVMNACAPRGDCPDWAG